MDECAAVEAGFAGVLDDSRLGLSDGERVEVRHFIDVGEYGVAYETLCEILKEKAAPIHPKAFAALAKLGGLMQFNPAAWGLSASK